VPADPGYDAVIIVSFGGPEGPDEVMPFLQHVLEGRPVPPERLDEVAGHYHRFGGISPINAHNRALVRAVGRELAAAGIDLPVYWGNRHWHPFLADEVGRMAGDGIRRALAFVTSAYASDSGCRQYLDDLARARQAVGPAAPEIDKLRLYYNHPGFVRANAARLGGAIEAAGGAPHVAFTAHSIPLDQAATSAYVQQISCTARLVVGEVDRADEVVPSGGLPWQLVYQSRSGRPGQPWLEPDINDHVRALAEAGVESVVVSPIGFTSDHMEVVYDLDVVARATAEAAGIRFVRASTVGDSPDFVTMIRQLVEERLDPAAPRLAMGDDGPWPDRCPPGCCPGPAGR
jgi:ferrochelatase